MEKDELFLSVLKKIKMVYDLLEDISQGNISGSLEEFCADCGKKLREATTELIHFKKLLTAKPEINHQAKEQEMTKVFVTDAMKMRHKEKDTVKDGYVVIGFYAKDAKSLGEPIDEHTYFFFPGETIDYPVLTEIKIIESEKWSPYSVDQDIIKLLRLFTYLGRYDSSGGIFAICDALFQAGRQYEQGKMRNALGIKKND